MSSEPVAEADLEFGAEKLDSSDIAVSREDAQTLMLALRRLNPRYRTALILREVHGLPVAEIAESLETTEGAVHTLLSRSRDALGRSLAEVSGAPPVCRDALALAFRRRGSGISEAEATRLSTHLERCPDCRRRVRQSDGPAPLSALLPLLSSPQIESGGAIARAFTMLSCDGAVGPALSSALQPAAKTAGTLLIAVALTVPGGSSTKVPSAQHTPVVERAAASTHSDRDGLSDRDVGSPAARTDKTGAAATDDRRTGRGASTSASAREEAAEKRSLSGGAGFASSGSRREKPVAGVPEKTKSSVPLGDTRRKVTKDDKADGDGAPPAAQGQAPEGDPETKQKPLAPGGAQGQGTGTNPGVSQSMSVDKDVTTVSGVATDQDGGR